MGAMIELKKSVPVVADVDVLIVGAGIAGATAAVAAGRNGAKTMVVDRFGCPGGNMGPGMVGGTLAVQSGITPRELDVKKLQNLLYQFTAHPGKCDGKYG